MAANGRELATAWISLYPKLCRGFKSKIDKAISEMEVSVNITKANIKISEADQEKIGRTLGRKIGIALNEQVANKLKNITVEPKVKSSTAKALGKTLEKESESSTTSGISRAAATGAAKLATAFTKASSKLLSGIRSAFSVAGSLASRVFTGAATTLGNVVRSALHSNVTTGITNGLNAAKVAIGNIVANIASSLASAISSKTSDAILRVDTLNNFPRVMQNMKIPIEESEKAINKLSDGIEGLPTTLDDIAALTQRITMVTGDVGLGSDYALALNNMIVGGGAKLENQSYALEQVAQAFAKNKFDLIEVRSLMQAAPAQFNQIAQKLNLTQAGLMAGLTKNDKQEGYERDVELTEFMEAIVALNKEGIDGFASFEEQAQSATKGIATALKNVGTAITKNLGNILNALGLPDFLLDVKKEINEFGKWITPKAGEISGKVFGNLRKHVTNATEFIKDKVDYIKNLVSPYADLFNNAKTVAFNAGSSIVDSVSSTVNTLNVPEAVMSGIGRIVSIVQEHLPGISSFVSQMANDFLNWVMSLDWNTIFKTIDSAISSVGQKISDLYSWWTTTGWTGIQTFKNEILDPLWKAFQNNWDKFASWGDELKKNLGESIGWLATWWDRNKATVLSALWEIWQYIKKIMEALTKVIGPATALVVGEIEELFQGFKWFADNISYIISGGKEGQLRSPIEFNSEADEARHRAFNEAWDEFARGMGSIDWTVDTSANPFLADMDKPKSDSVIGAAEYNIYIDSTKVAKATQKADDNSQGYRQWSLNYGLA